MKNLAFGMFFVALVSASGNLSAQPGQCIRCMPTTGCSTTCPTCIGVPTIGNCFSIQQRCYQPQFPAVWVLAIGTCIPEIPVPYVFCTLGGGCGTFPRTCGWRVNFLAVFIQSASCSQSQPVRLCIPNDPLLVGLRLCAQSTLMELRGCGLCGLIDKPTQLIIGR